MRDYGRIFSSFWTSEDIRALSEDGRTLALYLMTSPHANLIGCYRLPDAYAAEDLNWPSKRVCEGFSELIATGFASRDSGTKWVLIHKYLKWNGFENGNVAIAAQKAFDQVPSIALKALLAAALLQFGNHLKQPFADHLATLRQPFVNPEPEPEPEPILSQSRNQNQSPTTFGAPPLEVAPVKVEAVKVAKVSKDAKEPAPSVATWHAYAEAYLARYRTLPVRNAMVNGQLAQLVGRIGAEEAPEVAAWFVGHQNSFYVGAGHSVSLLLRDCEKLRMEWATNRRGTSTQALQADKTQTNFNAFAPLIEAAKLRELHGH